MANNAPDELPLLRQTRNLTSRPSHTMRQIRSADTIVAFADDSPPKLLSLRFERIFVDFNGFELS
eukprot:scaffold1021_cov241-Pinguiococcus_pyrenoidosus.AAC.17